MCADNQDLEEASKILLSSDSRQPPRVSALLLHYQELVVNATPQNWDENDLTKMDERLTTLLSLKSRDSESPVEVPESPLQQSRTLEPMSQAGLVRGWRLLDERTGWRPSPIGVYAGGS